jgi:excisionase family DNA binding protein
MNAALLTVKQAAAETGLPVSTIYSLITTGKLAEVRLPDVGGRRVWILRRDVEALLEKSRQVRA